MEELIPAYLDALCLEIKAVCQAAPHKQVVHSVFFGGGTPSLLTPGHVVKVLAAIHDNFLLDHDAEISLEGNPGTVSPESLGGYRHAGVNRLSLGVQSANPKELCLLDRIHNLKDVTNAVTWARQTGFDNMSLDLIFGLPGQTLESWQNSLKFAVDLGVEHLSLYNLTIEDGTGLKFLIESGMVPRPDDDLAADMYEWAMDNLGQSGFTHYEISNWALKRGDTWLSCRHNLQYWRNQPYFGFGAGAHGYLFGRRTANVLGIQDYIWRCQNGRTEFPSSPAVENAVEISRRDEMQETMMVGLRLLQEGVSREAFHTRFGVPIDQEFGEEIDELARLGLLEAGEVIRLTRRGCLVGNQVFMRFIGE